MCLAVPARIERVDDNGRAKAVFAGNKLNIILALVPEAKVGDWVPGGRPHHLRTPRRLPRRGRPSGERGVRQTVFCDRCSVFS